MSDEKRAYLLAYDIADDKRRTHIAKCLQSYGERLQYSVFYLEIRPARLLRIKQKVKTEMDEGTDSVLIVDLGQMEHARQALDFIGLKSYQDMEIPTVI